MLTMARNKGRFGTMEVKCQVCGKSVILETWSAEYEQMKQSPQHPFICRTCQDRIRSEAKNEQRL
jgi:uncharacterized protein YlaI